MKITPELVAIGILAVSLVSLGWKVSSDIKHELRQEIHHVRKDVAHVREDVALLGDRIGNLEQRMARLEGWMEGRFAGQPELKPKPAR